MPNEYLKYKLIRFTRMHPQRKPLMNRFNHTRPDCARRISRRDCGGILLCRNGHIKVLCKHNGCDFDTVIRGVK